jgi:hypothetical protein
VPGYLPKRLYLVVDPNRCRDCGIVEGLFRRCRREGLRVLLPDTAFYEFSKGSQAYQTWRRSLKYLCQEPQLVVAGRSVGQMMNEEI